MDRSSYFIPSKALFGSYPNQDSVNELESIGVRYFINLTRSSEALILYNLSDKSQRIDYPIIDRKVPSNKLSFSKFVIMIANIILKLNHNEKIYIHCKGGHGRSGVLVACLLCYMYNIEPNEALLRTTEYHSQRKEMRSLWRTIGSPQTIQQKNFVIRLFEPLFFYKAYKTGPTTGFSNFSTHSIYLKEFNIIFPSTEAAFNAFKDPDNKEYIEQLKNTKTPFSVKDLGKKCNLRTDWYERREEFMTIVINSKLNQHEDFKENLKNSFLRKIIHHTQKDKFWGDGPDGSGKNILGKILMKCRYNLIKNIEIP